MKCEEVTDRLLEYLYEELDPGDTRRVAGHLDGCPSCRRKLEGYQRVQGMARALPELSPPPSRFTALLAEAQAAVAVIPAAAVVPLPVAAPVQTPPAPEQAPSFWGRARSLLSPSVFAAASLALLVGASFLLLTNDSYAPPQVGEAARPAKAMEAAAPTIAPQAAQEKAAEIVATGGEGAPFSLDAKSKSADIPAQPAREEKALAIPVELREEQDAPPPPLAAPAPISPTTPSAGRGLGGNAPGDSLFVDGVTKEDETSGAPVSSAGTISAYDEAFSRGNNAYREGRYRDANTAYQDAEENASPGSAGWSSALLGQAQSAGAAKDCAGAEAAGRALPENSRERASALSLAGDCFLSANQPEKAQAAYQDAARYSGPEGAAAQRALTALETKLSKPSLDSNATKRANKSTKPAENAKPTEPAKADPQRKK